MNLYKYVFTVLSIVVMTGCVTTKSMYYWGEYENIIYNIYMKPGTEDTQTQIDKLNTDIQKAQYLGKKVPPGIHAHLGYMYSIQGEEAQSKAEFMEEKQLYPESKILIDGMLKRAEQQSKKLNERS